MIRKIIARTLMAIGVAALLFAGGCALQGIVFRPGPMPVGAPTPAPTGEGWIDLLAAENAGHWENITDEKDIFEIDGDTLHIYGKTIFPLRYVGYTERTFDHFDLHLEYKVADGANSGLFLRTQPNDPINRGFEVQVLEDHGKRASAHTSGAVYDVVTPMYNMSRPAGEWNSFDIRVEGHDVQVVMNGWKVIDTTFSEMTEPLGKFDAAYADMDPNGYIALQDHGGEVWYRNILVRPIAPDTDTAEKENGNGG